jgi:hypothetical protein
MASPLARLVPGDVIMMAEAVVPGRFAGGAELATDRHRATHAAFADRWRRDRDGAMWRGAKLGDAADKWLAAVHMPDWACRLTLRVAWTRTENLRAIGRADARAEGFGLWAPVRGFARAWDRTHAVPGLRWHDDPPVVVLGLVHDGA